MTLKNEKSGYSFAIILGIIAILAVQVGVLFRVNNQTEKNIEVKIYDSALTQILDIVKQREGCFWKSWENSYSRTELVELRRELNKENETYIQLVDKIISNNNELSEEAKKTLKAEVESLIIDSDRLSP